MFDSSKRDLSCRWYYDYRIRNSSHCNNLQSCGHNLQRIKTDSLYHASQCCINVSFLHDLAAVHDVMQEPHIYRMSEAVLHYGEAIKAIMNEECGKLLPREPLLESKKTREPKFLRGLKRLVGFNYTNICFIWILGETRQFLCHANVDWVIRTLINDNRCSGKVLKGTKA